MLWIIFIIFRLWVAFIYTNGAFLKINTEPEHNVEPTFLNYSMFFILYLFIDVVIFFKFLTDEFFIEKAKKYPTKAIIQDMSLLTISTVLLILAIFF